MACKIPPTLSFVANLSGGITIVISTAYLTLCIIALVFANCDQIDGTDKIPGFMDIIHRVYILDDKCELSESLDYVTQPKTVFILTIITLCMSAILLIAAIAFIVVTKYKTETVLIIGYMYVALSVGSLVVDLTFGIHFGLDYTAISEELDKLEVGEHTQLYPLLQLGSLLVMSIALKGYAVLLINIVLLILIVVYLEDYRDNLKKNQHSIHNAGVLHAYDYGPQANARNMLPAPAQSLARRSMRNSPPDEVDYVRPYNVPWQMQERDSGAPFSYLKESSAPSSGDVGWRRDWPAPPVPAPDYSPQPRRLKSAMKPNAH